MLSKDVFFEGMDKLLAFYPGWQIRNDDANVMKLWYEKFKHMDDERFMYMIDQYVDTETRFPTVAGLKECDTIPRKSRTQLEHEKMLREHGLL